MNGQGQTVMVRGKEVVCGHCGGTRFIEREAQLNTALMTFFDLDWLNASAQVLVCVACGHLEWFLHRTVQPEDDTREPAECLGCGGHIPAGQDKCPHCGWTYRE